MQHLSRTALKELKKRYLNVLKKCFLLNMMVFSCVTLSSPVLAETSEPTLTPSEALETVVETSRTTVSKDTIIDLAGKNLTYKRIRSSSNGSVFYIKEEVALQFINSDKTTDPLILFESNNAYSGTGGAIYNVNSNATITFGSDTIFSNNIAYSSAGAILNEGTITFDDESIFNGNSAQYRGGAILNVDGSITFGGDATFTDNLIKTTESSGIAEGGAISNLDSDTGYNANSSGIITFGGAATFSGNSLTATGSSGEAHGGAIYNNSSSQSGRIILFNDVATFMDNSATGSSNAYGGAIYNRNEGTITFGGDTIFSGNSVTSGGYAYGGAIYNDYGTIIFDGEASFIDNSVNSTGSSGYAYGGAIYNDYGPIIFDGEAYFIDNSVISIDSNGDVYGGAIHNEEGTITFDDVATFSGNSLTGDYAYGGAIHNEEGTITFDDIATFTDNSVTSGRYAYGGAIYNSGDRNTTATITFGGDATFTDNLIKKTGSSGIAEGGAIYNLASNTDYIANTSANAFITFGGDVTFTGNSLISTASRGSAYGGAIYNSATILNANTNANAFISFDGHVTFSDNSVTASSAKAYGGAIYNYAKNTNAIITFGENSTISFSENYANGELNDIYNEGGTINILGTLASDIHLISNGGTIALKAKDTDADGKVTYGGSYDLKNTTLDLSGDGVKEVTIDNLTIENSAVSWDAEIKDTENGYSVFYDTINGLQGNFSSGTVLLKSQNKDKWYKVSVLDLYNQPLIKEGGSIDYEIGGFYRMKDIVYGENGTDVTGFSINIVKPIILGEMLRKDSVSTVDLSEYNLTVNENEPINYIITAKDLIDGSMGEVGAGEKTIIGATDKASDTIINANGTSKLFNLSDGDELTLSNLTIMNANQALYNYNNLSSSVTLNNIYFKNNTTYFSSGGAIYNLASNVDHIANTSVNAFITFGGDATFTGNSLISTKSSESSYGGAIANSGYRDTTATITFGGDATFTGNSATGSSAYGGAIYNYGSNAFITFSGDATFTSNFLTSTSSSNYSYPKGGAIYNGNEGTITFDGNASFSGNSGTGSSGYADGGAIYNNGTITFNGETSFMDNSVIGSTSAMGGAISNHGSNYGYDQMHAPITFRKDVTFGGNAASFGSDIFNSNFARIIFEDDATFTGNSGSSITGGAIYNDKSDMVFAGKTVFTDYAAEYAGAVFNYNSGSITFEEDAAFTDNSVSSEGGAVYNEDSTIIFDGKTIFNNNTSSYLGGAIINYNGSVLFGENSVLSFNNNKANGELNDIYNEGGTINILGELKSDMHLISDGGFIRLKAKDTDNDGKVNYGGSYDLTDITLDISGDGAKEMTFQNLTLNNVSLKMDAEIKDMGDSYSVEHDTIKDLQKGAFYSGLIILSGGERDKWYDVLLTDIYDQQLIKDEGVSGYELGGFYRKKDIFDSEGKEVIGLTVNFAKRVILGDFLRSRTASTIDLSQYNLTVNEGEPITYMITGKDLLDGSIGELGKGEKIIIGATNKAEDTVIDANSVEQLFNLGVDDNLNMSNISITNAESSSAGGAIYNEQGSVTLNNVDFRNNNASDSGGAIYNERGSVTLNNVDFRNNNASDSGGAIYNNGGTILFGGDTVFSMNTAYYGGAIYNSNGNITFGDGGTFLFESNRTKESAGAIENYDTITFNGNVFFTNNVASVENDYDVFGGAISNGGTITFNGDATFTGNVANSSFSGYVVGGAICNYGDIAFNGDVTFIGNSAVSSYVFGGAIYNEDATITFGENSKILFSNNKEVRGSSEDLSDIYNSYGTINILGTVASDIHLISEGGTIVLKAKDTDADGKVNYGGTYYLTDTILDVSGDGLKEVILQNLMGSSSLLKLDVLMKQAEDGSVSLTGDKVISESAYTFMGVDLGGIENIVLSQSGDMTPIIDQQTVTVLGGNVRFADGVNSSSLISTGSPYVYEMMASGQDITVSASKLADGITSMQYLTTYAGDSTLKMKGNETEISYNIGASEDLGSIAVGKKQIIGAFDDPSKSVITANGKSMFSLENEGTELVVKDLTISGAKEVINNKVGIVSLENVIVSDTTEAVAIQNEASLNLKDVMIDKGINNEGSIIAEGKLSVSELEGTGVLTMNEATLDVMDKFETSNKVISNNMVLGDNVKEISFKELEIKEGTTLDIDNKHVTADKVRFGKESTLSVTLNHLADHGRLSHEEVAGDEEAKLILKLTEGLDQEEGIYQVFNKDNNLALEKNGLIDVIDMQDGSYKVAKKSVETLSQELGTTKEESTVANALLSGNSEKEEFVQVQTELLEALQSENKATFARAKKALNAVGSGNTSIYQAQATAHFTQMHAVISQMLMNTSTGVFGHNGGEEPARATVYMKGLYDRVNSLTGSGFRMRSKGAVLGVQSHITEDLTVGVGYAATNTIAKEELRRTEVDTNTGFISAQYQPNDWWMSGVLTYSRSQYEEAKEVMSNKGKSSYNVDSLGVQVNTGYNVQIGDWIITPEVGVRYINARQESYEDSFGTKVDGTNSDYLTAMAGFKVGVDLKWIRPLAGVMVGYDIISDDITSVNTLANGATYKVEGKALDRLSTTVVAGFAADLGDSATLKLEYLGNYRKEYLDHSGMIRLEHKF